MRTTTFEHLVSIEPDFNNFLSSLGIKSVLPNRWNECFKLVQELNKARASDTVDDIDPARFGLMRFALLDLQELEIILKGVSDESNTELVKKKFILLLQGVQDRTVEAQNTVARDTQFELVLYSELKCAGFQVALRDPNPDLEIKLWPISYGIECKRIFSTDDNSMIRNIRAASSQLRNNYIRKNKHGIIAISVDRFLTGENKQVQAFNEQDARTFMSSQVERFVNEYGNRWNNPAIIDNDSICAIIIYMSFIGSLDTENIVSRMAYKGISNTRKSINGKRQFNRFKADIASPLQKSIDSIR